MVRWYHGTKAPWYHVAVVHHGAMEKWYHGAMVPWYHGAMVQWRHALNSSWKLGPGTVGGWMGGWDGWAGLGWAGRMGRMGWAGWMDGWAGWAVDTAKVGLHAGRLTPRATLFRTCMGGLSTLQRVYYILELIIIPKILERPFVRICVLGLPFKNA